MLGAEATRLARGAKDGGMTVSLGPAWGAASSTPGNTTPSSSLLTEEF